MSKVSLDFFEPNQRLNIKREVELKSINRILVQGIDQLGGLMQSTPFFRELRRAFPQAYIVNLVGPLTYGVMQNCPYVDEVWLFNKKESFSTAKRIREVGFDITFLASGTLRTALIALLGKIPNRVGYNTDGTGRLLTVELNQEFHSRYRTENLFDFLRAIGISPQNIYDREMWLNDDDRAFAEQWLETFNPLKQAVLAFNPFSTDPKRRWTDEGWQGLLQGLMAREIKPIMLVAPNEVEPGKELLMAWGGSDVAVESHSVTKTGAILEHVNYVVGPESGFIHMALAVNKPHAIALFNVLPPKATFPVNDSNHLAIIEDSLPCCPCYLYKFKDQCPYKIECMTGIDSQRVLNAIDAFAKSDALNATAK